MAGRNGYIDRRRYAYEEDDEDHDPEYDDRAYRYGYGGDGRGAGGRANNSSGHQSQRYNDRRYDAGAYLDARYYDGDARPRAERDGSQGRGAYVPPTADTTNGGGGGPSRFPARRLGAPGSTRYPNPSTAYEAYASTPPRPSPSPSPPPPPPPTTSSSRQSSQGFGGVAGQLLNAAGHLSPSSKMMLHEREAVA
ncbi:unnamed protein product, partial [Scytosiphon promiscuus]